MKKISILSVCKLTLILAACAPGLVNTTTPPGTDLTPQLTFLPTTLANTTTLPGIDLTPQLTILPSALPTVPAPGDTFVSWIAYANPITGLQSAYPSHWFRREGASSPDIWGNPAPIPSVSITSFDPANPPHKLEWTEETISIQIRAIPYVMVQFNSSLPEWTDIARQNAIANQLTVFEEESFLIANQPAHRLTLVSGSGGIIHQVLTILGGRHFEINIEGNLTLAKPVLDSMQPDTSTGPKPADNEEPAAGICSTPTQDVVNILLGNGIDGIPVGGRCSIVSPTQRIKLLNQSGAIVNILFSEFIVNLQPGHELLLDKPISEYLASGVHDLPIGPELWVKLPDAPTVTPIPPPPLIRFYSNPEVGYTLGIPGDWMIDENGMVNSLYKDVIFSPPNAEPFIAYLSISLEYRTLDQIIMDYGKHVPDALGANVDFHGYPGLKYEFPYDRNEYFISFGGKTYLIATDRPNDPTIQSILMSIQFTSSNSTLELTQTDNGKTIHLNVGDRLQLNFGTDGYDWSLQMDNENVLSLEQSSTTGIIAVFLGKSAGTANIIATGNPACAHLIPPCMIPSLLFQITVVVP